MIDRLTESYLRSGGELTAVYRTLIESEECWTGMYSKYKTPNDFAISTLRAFKHVPDNSRFIIGALDLMGQTPFRPGSPAGWPDTAEQWGGADALYKRIEWSTAVARHAGSRVNPLALGEVALGPALGDHTKTAISRADSAEQGLTLLLASPEFQRR